MIPNKVADLLNEQINKEMYSSYLYLSMAAWFEANAYDGFANWMQKQSQEEYGHAMKIYTYLHDAGAKVKLLAIDEPKSEWSKPKEIFEEALEHEKMVTESINNVANVSVEEKDHATNIFMHWFVQEQVEEEKTAQDIVDKFNMLEDNKSALYLLNKELGGRQ